MTWLSTIAPVVKAQIEANVLPAPVSPAFTAEWRDAKRPFVHPDVQAEILLQVTAVRPVITQAGVAPVAANLVRTVEGMRIVTLQIQAHSHNQDAPFWGLEMLERLCMRLEKQSVSDALKAVNCGITDYGPITHVPDVKADDRHVSVASVDVFLCAAFTDTDGSESVGYFTKIELTGKVENPGGTEYPSSLNPQAVLIPPGV